MERGVQDSDDSSALKRPTTRQQLEQDGTSGKEIAPGVDHPTGQLFRCHVARSAQHRSAVRETCRCLQRRLRLQPRQAEVEQLHTVGREEHIRGFEIAVDDTPGVQCRKRSENSQFDRQRVGDAERAAPQPLG